MWVFDDEKVMMLGCCKTCMGCHEAGTGGCHVSRWCDIVTLHRMLPRTPWWDMDIVKWEEIILVAVSSSQQTPYTHTMKSWTGRSVVIIWSCHLCRVLQTSSATWHPIRCSAAHYSCHVPGFSVIVLKFMLGVGLERWEMSFLTPHTTAWNAGHGVQRLPIFANIHTSHNRWFGDPVWLPANVHNNFTGNTDCLSSNKIFFKKKFVDIQNQI